MKLTNETPVEEKKTRKPRGPAKNPYQVESEASGELLFSNVQLDLCKRWIAANGKEGETYRITRPVCVVKVEAVTKRKLTTV